MPRIVYDDRGVIFHDSLVILKTPECLDDSGSRGLLVV